MNEELVKFAVVVVTAASGATAYFMNRTNKREANKKEIALATIKENSLGETLAKQIKEELAEARKERQELRQDISDIKEDNRKDRIEKNDAIHRFGHQHINDITELLAEVKALNKSK